MCSVENILKISNILKVNPGKLGYNADKIVTRQTKSNEILSGFTTVLLSIARESKESMNESLKSNTEIQCLISQWLDYAALFVSSSTRDKHMMTVLLKELNHFLSEFSYLVGNNLTIADLAVYYTIHDIINAMSPNEKEIYLNISRWFDHLQQNKIIQQGNKKINFSTIHLVGWVTGGTHI